MCECGKQKDRRRGPRPAETIEKIRQAKLGPKNPNYGKFGKDNPCFGKKRTKEQREHFSRIRKGTRMGALSSNWRGGITPLSRLIGGSSEYYHWRNSVMRRDVVCLECGTSENLEVHHKKPFSVLQKEFLDKYSMFSPIEDVTSLSSLARDYKDFWDLNNGETLCVKCHLGKRHQTWKEITSVYKSN